MIAVIPPTYAIISNASGVNIGNIRTTIYTPAATIVAAWMRALTGVGPSIASGSQICRGNCADLPTAPIKTKIPEIVRRVILSVNAPLRTPSINPSIWKVPIAKKRIIMPINMPISPTLLVKNAFLQASAALSFSNQKPISR